MEGLIRTAEYLFCADELSVAGCYYRAGDCGLDMGENNRSITSWRKATQQWVKRASAESHHPGRRWVGDVGSC